MARSITSCSTCAAKNLITDTSTRASSPSSILRAASSVISRHAWMPAAESAIQFWIVCLSASREPNASRSSEYEHISSNARCIWPSQRITWWMRPGPSRFCAIRNPSPGSPSVFATGTRTPRYQTSQCVDQPLPAWPSTGIGRTTSTPGVSAGTMICEARECAGASGSLTAITIAERRAVGAGREPLVPVDHPLVAVAHRARAERGRVRAGDLGLGHREERADLARDEREEPALLLLGRPEHVQDLARCRRRAPGSRRRAARTSSGRSPRSGARRRGSPCRCRPPPAERAAPRGPPPSPSPGASGSAPGRPSESARSFG